jgi:hypothetical protein
VREDHEGWRFICGGGIERGPYVSERVARQWLAWFNCQQARRFEKGDIVIYSGPDCEGEIYQRWAVTIAESDSGEVGIGSPPLLVARDTLVLKYPSEASA